MIKYILETLHFDNKASCAVKIDKNNPLKKFQTWGYTPNVPVLDPPLVITPIDITFTPLIF